jgi:hypothetical protein
LISRLRAAAGRPALASALTLLSLLATWGLLLTYFRPSLLTLDTMTAGGDTPSFHHPIEHLRDVLLPAGNPQGWDLGNFAGYTPYRFYFLPPSLAVIALSAIVPFNVAFKLVTVTGIFLLPLATVLALRALGYAFPIPAIGAAASLLFLFNEGNSMWGGNIPSTLAGEFSYSIAFALAVLFAGLLYRGVQTGRGRRGLAVLLAAIGLCHPLALVNASACGLYFLLDPQRFRRNVAYLAPVYVTAGLLMGFWLLPLAAGLPYATSIHWAWRFQSWQDVLPHVLLPAAALAAADAVRLARGAAGTPGRYLLFCFATTLLAFASATRVGVPDIRFVPFGQVLLVLLALDLLAAVAPLVPAVTLPAIALVAAILGWVQSSATYIPSWIRWNYEGVEGKGSHPTLQKITQALQGAITDPRVVYENSPSYDVFGSMRIFESLPRLSHRATLEGVLLQTAVTSPFVYYLQSLTAQQGTSVIPGYTYPVTDPGRATPRLDLFNVRDYLAVTPAVKGALDGDARWTRVFSLEPYAIYRRVGADGHYVRVPRYHPVMVETRGWKQDFHRWFSRDDALDVPIVAAGDVPPSERHRFPRASGWPAELPRVPERSDCQIEEKLSSMSIEFSTTCPGVPHWISMAYHPAWHVDGASRVFLVSPAFMLVFPDGRSVRLTFGRTAADWAGIVASLVGIGLCVGLGRMWTERSATAETAAAPRRVPLPVLIVVAAAVAAAGWSITRTAGSQYFYRRGWSAMERRDYDAARREFDRALVFGDHAEAAADALFFRASSLFRAGDAAAARRAYEELIARRPDSDWVAESRYQIGICLEQLGQPAAAAAMYRKVVAEHPGSPWSPMAADRLRALAASPAP